MKQSWWGRCGLSPALYPDRERVFFIGTSGLRLEQGRRYVAQRAVRTNCVVMGPPLLDDAPGIGEIQEPVLVQAAVPEAAVEGFHEGILRRLPGLDEVKLDLVFLTPEKHRLAGHLGFVIEHQGRG